MKSILIISNFYLPGSHGGGPIRTISNLVQHLDGKYKFMIYTSDRDLGMTHAYDSVKKNLWIDSEHAKLFYSEKGGEFTNLILILKNLNYDCIYLNSFFSFNYSFLILILIRLLNINNKKVIIAPRGEFNENALLIKGKKKRVFLKIVKFFRLYKDVIWQATSEKELLEIKEIKSILGVKGETVLVPNLPESIYYLERNLKNENGVLRICFISRISRMKNLIFALNVLREIKFDVLFNIYGPQEDELYLAECKKVVLTLPCNIKVVFHGSIPNSDVKQTLAKHDLFLLPTLGENYGHAIVEALSIGLPVLISDNTPWRNLETHRAGWDISLDDIKLFRNVLESFNDLSEADRRLMSESAFKYAQSVVFNESVLKSNIDLFS